MLQTGHSSSLLPSTTTSDSPAQQGYDARGRMLDWKDPVGSSENINPYVAVSSHNHQDKKGKALEIILPVVGSEGEWLQCDCFQLDCGKTVKLLPCN